jgi:hypothetical protein
MAWLDALRLTPEEKLQWRYEDIRRAQRRRRARNRRIDYQNVSSEAGKIIDKVRAELQAARGPHAYSDAINAIVVAWAAQKETP